MRGVRSGAVAIAAAAIGGLTVGCGDRVTSSHIWRVNAQYSSYRAAETVNGVTTLMHHQVLAGPLTTTTGTDVPDGRYRMDCKIKDAADDGVGVFNAPPDKLPPEELCTTLVQRGSTVLVFVGRGIEMATQFASAATDDPGYLIVWYQRIGTTHPLGGAAKSSPFVLTVITQTPKPPPPGLLLPPLGNVP
jgi:hypothetical protein